MPVPWHHPDGRVAMLALPTHDPEINASMGSAGGTWARLNRSAASSMNVAALPAGLFPAAALPIAEVTGFVGLLDLLFGEMASRLYLVQFGRHEIAFRLECLGLCLCAFSKGRSRQRRLVGHGWP